MSDELWDVLCAGLPLLAVLFALNVVLLTALVLVFPFVERGTSSYYLSVASFAIIGASLVGIGAVIRKCRAR